MFQADEIKPGDPISARMLNAFFAELERLGKFAVVAPMTIADEAGGVALGVDLLEPWWIKLTAAGTAGKYAWTRQFPTSSGGWANAPGPQSGTTTDDPAIETSGNTSVNLSPNPVVRAWRDPLSGNLLFQAGSC